MKHFVLASFLLLALAVPSFAQTGTPTVPVNTAFTVAADHNALEVGKESDGYRLFINGVLSRTATVAEVWTGTVTAGGTVQFTVAAGLPKGTHVLEIAAFNETAEAKSDPLSVKAQAGAPNKPWNIRIVVTVQ